MYPKYDEGGSQWKCMSNTQVICQAAVAITGVKWSIADNESTRVPEGPGRRERGKRVERGAKGEAKGEFGGKGSLLKLRETGKEEKGKGRKATVDKEQAGCKMVKMVRW
jgi:hypothetical protein